MNRFMVIEGFLKAIMLFQFSVALQNAFALRQVATPLAAKSTINPQIMTDLVFRKIQKGLAIFQSLCFLLGCNCLKLRTMHAVLSYAISKIMLGAQEDMGYVR